MHEFQLISKRRVCELLSSDQISFVDNVIPVAAVTLAYSLCLSRLYEDVGSGGKLWSVNYDWTEHWTCSKLSASVPPLPFVLCLTVVYCLIPKFSIFVHKIQQLFESLLYTTSFSQAEPVKSFFLWSTGLSIILFVTFPVWTQYLVKTCLELVWIVIVVWIWDTQVVLVAKLA